MDADAASAAQPAAGGRESGVAPVKAEFLFQGLAAGDAAAAAAADAPSTAATDYSPTSAAYGAVARADAKRPLDNGDGDEQADGRDAKRRKPELKERRGQNKNRKKARLGDGVCSKMLRGEPCTYGDRCKFSHDIAKYLETKPPDLPGTCPFVAKHGWCRFALGCRFAGSHPPPASAGYSPTGSAYGAVALAHARGDGPAGAGAADRRRPHEELSGETGWLSIETRNLLRKRKWKFPKSDAYFRSRRRDECDNADGDDDDGDGGGKGGDGESKEGSGGSAGDAGKPDGNGAAAAVDMGAAAATAEESGAAAAAAAAAAAGPKDGVSPDSGRGAAVFAERDRAKRVDFRDKLLLAPLTTVGNLPFRRVAKAFGADITYSEMTLALNLLRGQPSEWSMVRRHECEDVFGVQVAGNKPDVLARAVEILQDEADVDFVDLNVGCPIDGLCKTGCCAGLMRARSSKFEKIVRAMSGVATVPLSIKLRTGYTNNTPSAHTWIPKLKIWGADLITVHGRSKEARYTKLADWDYIDKCATLASPVPFVGNGDVLSCEDVEEHRRATRVSSVMIGRGALIKPWIFTEIKERRSWDISSSERFEILRDFSRFGLEHWGSDTEGVEKTRRFMLEWCSFLHRYVPVGLLERLPQRINERPPRYFGRDELETLMASPSSSDWIKLTEMLLGPAHKDLHFVPKHKSNAYATNVAEEWAAHGSAGGGGCQSDWG